MLKWNLHVGIAEKSGQSEKHKQVVACSTIELMALHCDGYLISDLLLVAFYFSLVVAFHFFHLEALETNFFARFARFIFIINSY